MNCQADMPAARATTSSSRRDRFEVARHRADQHAERHDALGDLRHAVERGLGHQQRRDIRDVAGAPHHLDIVEQRDQRENADEHQQHRAQEAQCRNIVPVFRQ